MNSIEKPVSIPTAGTGTPVRGWLLLLLACLVQGPIARAVEDDNAFRPLGEMARRAESIVVARSISDQPGDGLQRNLILEIDRTLKGPPQSTLKLQLSQRRAVYPLVSHGRPVLLFLRTDETGPSVLFTLEFDAPGETLDQAVPLVERYLELSGRTGAPRDADLTSFLVANLKRLDGSWLKQSAAVELVPLSQRETGRFSDTDRASVAAVAQESGDPLVVFPLCHVLQALGSNALDEVCLRAILTLDPSRAGMFELDPLLNRRVSLRKGLIEAAKTATNSVDLDRLLNALTRTLGPDTVADLQQLKEANPAARAALQFYSSRLSPDDRKQFE